MLVGLLAMLALATSAQGAATDGTQAGSAQTVKQEEAGERVTALKACGLKLDSDSHRLHEPRHGEARSGIDQVEALLDPLDPAT